MVCFRVFCLASVSYTHNTKSMKTKKPLNILIGAFDVSHFFSLTNTFFYKIKSKNRLNTFILFVRLDLRIGFFVSSEYYFQAHRI